DIDFGGAERRGYRRVIPHDFGAPVDVVAASPDAAADVTVVAGSSETEIRVGDPDRTFRGQHRYELAYTLPDAFDPTADRPELVLDIVAPLGPGTGAAETGRFEVVVTGFELTEPLCHVGRAGDRGGCELVPAAHGPYRAVPEPPPKHAGRTSGGLG